MKILCRTLFDCTCTGITGNFRVAQLPINDRNEKTIVDQEQWNFSRNQQRNWETLLQMISLRALPTIVKYPTKTDHGWSFEFEVETPGVYSATGDESNTDALLYECAGIPMITGLTENKGLEPQLIVQGVHKNIWFETVNNA
jgi:hypothetical protein